MASIKRHGPSWQARVRVIGYPTQTRTFSRKVDAQHWANGLETEMRQGSFIDRRATDQQTFGDLLEVYLEKHADPLRNGDQHGYLVRKWLNAPICNRRLSSLQGKDFAALRDERLKVVSKKTVREDLLMFRKALELGRKEWGFSLPTNPIDDITIPSSGRGRDRRLEADEESRLLEATASQSSPWLRPVIELAIETAMRRGELVGLEWKHVDLDRRVAHLPMTKNGEARDVPLSETAVSVLEALPRRLNGEVFPIAADDLTHKFVALCRSSQIEDLRFHDLRHEAISRLFERTSLSVMEIASISGHKTLQMLVRYTHLRADNNALKTNSPANKAGLLCVRKHNGSRWERKQASEKSGSPFNSGGMRE